VAQVDHALYRHHNVICLSHRHAGLCEAFVTDTTYLNSLFTLVDLEAESISPYAFAVAKGNTALRVALAGAFVQQMQNYNESQVLQWEAEYILPTGIPVNRALAAQVRMISNFTYLATEPVKPPTPAPGPAPPSGAVDVSMAALWAATGLALLI
jgi:hypothetical protein